MPETFGKRNFDQGCQNTQSSKAIWLFRPGLSLRISSASNTLRPNKVPELLIFKILKQDSLNFIKLSCFNWCSAIADALLAFTSLPVLQDLPMCSPILNET